ncbi:MAG: hypothetical protein KF764_06955 [Labilithrix sp.]|nr:hypothetical protein [Labilithrix sp.]
MRNAISEGAILAALAALSVSSLTAGCSKTESAAPAPEATAAAAASASPPPSESAAAPPTTPVAPTAAAATETPAAQAAVHAVDAGTELRAPTAPPSRAPSRGASAACGAQGCSPDMKKGTK